MTETPPTSVLPLIGMALAASVTLVSSVAMAKPKPNEDGLLFCAKHNDRSVGEPSFDEDTRKCCYWEGDGKGGALRVCLTCDENWKNCEESIPSRGPIATTPGLDKAAPQSGTSGDKTKVPSIELTPQYKLQRKDE